MHEPHINYIEQTDSTMLEARRLAEKGAASGAVVWAGYQTAGRGRITDRRWESKPGDGLLFTVLFTKSDLSGRMGGRSFTLLPLLCGLAVAEAAGRFLGEYGSAPAADLRIKWPNDVLADGRKLCGILCEASGDYVYAGIGINLNQTEFPGELRRPAVSIRQLLSDGGRIGLEGSRALLELVIRNLDAAFRGPAWKESLESKLYKYGEIVRMKPGLPEEIAEEPEMIEGRLAGINASGALLIETPNVIIPVISGELLI